MNHHRALACCLRMIFSENRFTLFRIMRWTTTRTANRAKKKRAIGALFQFRRCVRR
jgi:hypothetical protein